MGSKIHDLHSVWKQPGKTFAAAFRKGWLRPAVASGIEMLAPVDHHDARGSRYWTTGSLWRSDLGRFPGWNELQDQDHVATSYGLRGYEFLKVTILASHETMHVLIE